MVPKHHCELIGEEQNIDTEIKYTAACEFLQSGKGDTKYLISLNEKEYYMIVEPFQRNQNYNGQVSLCEMSIPNLTKVEIVKIEGEDPRMAVQVVGTLAFLKNRKSGNMTLLRFVEEKLVETLIKSAFEDDILG